MSGSPEFYVTPDNQIAHGIAPNGATIIDPKAPRPFAYRVVQAAALAVILRLHAEWYPTRWDVVPQGTRADLTRAVLTGADLTRAVLTGADLTAADLTGADLTGADLTGAVLTGAVLTGADLTGAVLTGAVLTGAVLTRAVLTGAVLTRAVLTGARDDVWSILDENPAEVPGLLAAVREGRINGRVYEGDCACLVGTIANERRKISGGDVDVFRDFRTDGSRPAERWFLAIHKGCTPESWPISRITEGWIVEWMARSADQPASAT